MGDEDSEFRAEQPSPERQRLLARGVRLEWLTVGWNLWKAWLPY